MNYLILSVLLILLVFIATLSFTMVANKNNSFKENIRFSGMMLAVSLPIISLVGGTLFLIFKLVSMVVPMQIDTIQVFLIALIGVFIIFACDLVSKQILAGISSRIFATKYKNQDLTEKEMLDIINKSQGIFNIFELVIMFFTSAILYLGVMKLISIDINLIFLSIISLMNVISYRVFFRSKISTGN